MGAKMTLTVRLDSLAQQVFVFCILGVVRLSCTAGLCLCLCIFGVVRLSCTAGLVILINFIVFQCLCLSRWVFSLFVVNNATEL